MPILFSTRVLAFVAACLALPFHAKAADSLQVLNARYGVIQTKAPDQPDAVCHTGYKDSSVNLIAAVQKACKDSVRSCYYTVPAPTQDPGFGCYKSFTASYVCNSDSRGALRTIQFGGKTQESSGMTAHFDCLEYGSVSFTRTKIDTPWFQGGAYEFAWTLYGYARTPMGGRYTLSGDIDTRYVNNGIKRDTLTFKQAECLLTLPYSDPTVGRSTVYFSGTFNPSRQLGWKMTMVGFNFGKPAAGSAAAKCLNP